MKKILLIDGSSILSTSYYGNLPYKILKLRTETEREKEYHTLLQTKDGVYTNGVYTMLKSVFAMIKLYKPTHIAIAWDITRNTFRKELYKEYKAHRDETPKPLKEQFSTSQELFEKIGFPQFKNERYEADDFLGSLSEKFKDDYDVKIAIWTKDTDSLQLVDDNVSILLRTSKAKDLNEKYGLIRNDLPDNVFEVNMQNIEEEYGVNPEQIIDLKALIGDKSDNIPGIKGVGETSAIPLIKEYETIENLYDNIEGLDKNEEKEIKTFWKEDLGIKKSPLNALLKISDTELVGKESALLSKKLATIKKDIDLNINLDDLLIRVNKEDGLKEIEKLGFKSLIEDFKSL